MICRRMWHLFKHSRVFFKNVLIHNRNSSITLRYQKLIYSSRCLWLSIIIITYIRDKKREIQNETILQTFNTFIIKKYLKRHFVEEMRNASKLQWLVGITRYGHKQQEYRRGQRRQINILTVIPHRISVQRQNVEMMI